MVLWVTGGDQKESLVGGAGVEPATSPLLAFGALFLAELSAFSRHCKSVTGTLASSPVLGKWAEVTFTLVHVVRRTLPGFAAYRADEPWCRVTLRRDP